MCMSMCMCGVCVLTWLCACEVRCGVYVVLWCRLFCWWCVVWCVWFKRLRTRRVCPGSCLHAANWVAERLGASSRRPHHPFPAQMAGVNPGHVPVYTALKKLTHSHDELDNP